MTQIFEAYDLPHIHLKNRIVRSATHDYVQNEDGTVSPAQIAIYTGLAKNDVGLLMTGHFYVHPSGQASQPQNSIADESVVPSLCELTQAVHAAGGKIVAQLGHAGAKAMISHPMAPSALTLTEGKPARPMTFEEIGELRGWFVDAADRAKRAGFDGVQLHVAHHYLLSLFVTPSLNLRTDRYGATPENRFRVVAEIVAGIKARCGAEFPVFLKMNSNVPVGDAAYEEELLADLRQCQALGVEAVELSGYEFSSHRNERTYYLARAARLRKQVELPIILVGGVRSSLDMQRVLDAGLDMAALSRPFICEEDLIPKMHAGQITSRCLSCNQCFTLPNTAGVRCVLHKKQ